MQKRIIQTLLVGWILICWEMHLEKASKNNEYENDSIEKTEANCYSLMRETIPSSNISRLKSLPKMSYLSRSCSIQEYHRAKVVEVVRKLFAFCFDLIAIS